MSTFVFDFYIAGTKSYGVVWQYAETESRAREMILEKVDSVKSADLVSTKNQMTALTLFSKVLAICQLKKILKN